MQVINFHIPTQTQKLFFKQSRPYTICMYDQSYMTILYTCVCDSYIDADLHLNLAVWRVQQDDLLRCRHTSLWQYRWPLRYGRKYGYLRGVLSCFCEKIWSYLPLYSIGWCQYRPEVTWPAEMESLPPPPYFNAGMFVFEPNPLTYESLLHTLQITPPTPFAEQVSHTWIITMGFR